MTAATSMLPDRSTAFRSAVGRVRECLEVVASREPDVQAWVHLDPARALEEASFNDRHHRSGSLHGLVVGVKDIFDTADAPTCLGSEIYAGRRPVMDAAVVTQLRRRGATVLGKTVTTEFASARPPKTRNPHNLAHSPGGSSSGSAAAVAAGMVPVALGTQTLGSVIRPASYCGVVGFKPTHGRISRTGVMALSNTLDTVGMFATTVEDMARLYQALSDHGAFVNPTASGSPPKLAICKGPSWVAASEYAQHALLAFVEGLRAEGAAVDELILPQEFDSLPQAARTIHDFEVRQNFASERFTQPAKLSSYFQAILTRGDALDVRQYETTLLAAETCRKRFGPLVGEYDGLLTLSATDDAPLHDASTGDPVMNAFWTLLHVPCISLPKLRGSAGLPLGVQLVGKRFSDIALLRTAGWLENCCAESV